MKPLGISILCAACLSLGSVGARAQTLTGSFGELAELASRRVLHGERVTITTGTGETVSGRLDRVTPSTLLLNVNGQARQFEEAEITSVRQLSTDSILNGTVIGFAAGAGCAIAVANTGEEAGYVAAVLMLPYGLAGAGVGALLDLMIPTARLIYRRSGSGTTRLSLSPILSHDRRGLRASVSF